MAQEIFQEILDELAITRGAEKGQWFGLPALKIGGKIFAALWLNSDMIFKLRDESHAEALALEGAVLFQPLADRNPMREWVQVPPTHAHRWRAFAGQALLYVQETFKPRVER